MPTTPTILAQYDQPHQFEPLLPTQALDELALLSRPVVEAALRLQGATNAHTRLALRDKDVTVNRGLARQREDYDARLSEADMPRHGDDDGRGNLSDKMLQAWCRFFIGVCQDQVNFMTQTLQLDTLKDRISALVLVRSHERADLSYRKQAILPLHHVLAVGPISRGDFIQMTGLGERTGCKLVAQLLKDGLLQSDTPKGEVRIGFPLNSLHLLFPNLYPEAASDPRDI